jgi:ParB-like chromosome segregation protein Spo0J
MLDEGIHATVSEIGDAENISKSYVSRTLRLALLAPDIVEGHPRGDGSGGDARAVGAAASDELGGAAGRHVSRSWRHAPYGR